MPASSATPASPAEAGGPGGSRPLYFDASATAPPADAVLAAMEAVHRGAWANPSSLHGFGLRAAEQLERCRLQLAELVGAEADELLFTSGGSESIHLALLGSTAHLPPGRVLMSAVEHPATLAATARLRQSGWEVVVLPVDRTGRLDLDALDAWLAPPTRLLSLIWGQSEVGSLQDVDTIGQRCRRAGVLLHLDAVQVVGHQPLQFRLLPVDLLSFTAHKLQGPRGIGALLVRQGLPLAPLIGGGGQERGRRGGTEPVALAAGLAAAVALSQQRLDRGGGIDPLAALRDRMLAQLLQLEGVTLSGPDPRRGEPRLPHHLSLLVCDHHGTPLQGRRLVRALWQQGIACSSGSACSSAAADAASPVLKALGYPPEQAASGLRFSLGPWLSEHDCDRVAEALERARCSLES